jgi:hypothetical protein
MKFKLHYSLLQSFITIIYTLSLRGGINKNVK